MGRIRAANHVERLDVPNIATTTVKTATFQTARPSQEPAHARDPGAHSAVSPCRRASTRLSKRLDHNQLIHVQIHIDTETHKPFSTSSSARMGSVVAHRGDVCRLSVRGCSGAKCTFKSKGHTWPL